MVKIINYPSDKFNKESALKLKEKNPDRIPVLVSKLHDDLHMEKTKFLVPLDLTMGQLQYVFRRSLKIDPTEAIFIFVNNKILATTSDLTSSVYDKYNTNGYLYVSIAKENTFG